jgi:hypothetical protein
MRKLIIDSSKSIFEMKIDDEGYTLSMSGFDREWTQPDKVVAEFSDKHDFIEIKLDRKRGKIKLDYDEAQELFFLLREYYKGDKILEAELK